MQEVIRIYEKCSASKFAETTNHTTTTPGIHNMNDIMSSKYYVDDIIPL